MIINVCVRSNLITLYYFFDAIWVW